MSHTIAKDPTIENVFPEGVLCHQRWGMLVNGLGQDAVPQGNILGSAISAHDKNRVFHMLDCNDERVKVGIFHALPGDDAPCYALILERAPVNSRAAEDMFYTYEQKIKDGQFFALPKDIEPTIENANRFIEQLNASQDQGMSL